MDTEFTLVAQKGTLRLLFDDSIQPASILKMNARTFHEAMAGTLNLPASLLSKALVIEGDTRSVLALTKLGKALNTTYQTVFEEIHQ